MTRIFKQHAPLLPVHCPHPADDATPLVTPDETSGVSFETYSDLPKWSPEWCESAAAAHDSDAEDLMSKRDKHLRDAKAFFESYRRSGFRRGYDRREWLDSVCRARWDAFEALKRVQSAALYRFMAKHGGETFTTNDPYAFDGGVLERERAETEVESAERYALLQSERAQRMRRDFDKKYGEQPR